MANHQSPQDVGDAAAHIAAPEDYQQTLDQGMDSLDVIPRDDNWEHSRHILENAPTAEAVADAQRQAAAALELLRTMQESRYTGSDTEELTRVTLDASGRISGLEFDVRAIANGARTVADAIKAAWDDAERRRESDSTRLDDLARQFGGR